MPNSREIKLSVIVVNYESEQYLNDCIVSIYDKFLGFPVEIILVNNDSKEALEKIKKTHPETKVIIAPKNLGFGAACNIGSKEAKGEYLLFLNPDTEIISADLKAVFEKMEPVGIGICGLEVVDKKKEQQAWTVGYHEMDLYDLIRNNLAFFKKNNKNGTIFWVSGAALMMKRNLFADVGGFDENFFLYFEDIDICKRVREKGKKIIHTADIVVRHVEGGSQHDRIRQKKDFYASQDYYFKKYFSLWTGMTVRILRKIFV